MSNDITRRTLLTAGAVGAGAVALAACGSSSGSDAGPEKSQPAQGPSSGPSTGAASSPAGPSGSAAGATGLVALDSVAVGSSVSVTLPGGKPGIVSRPTSTTAACFSAICTHQGCTVKPAGGKLDCPCHGSVFNALTGAVLNGPAPSPLPTVAVTVQNGQVVVTG